MEQDYVCRITPIEFEKYCKEVLLGYAEEEKLPDFRIAHDVKLKAHDGDYQIDIYATFMAMGVEFKVICECKQYKESVKRDEVIILTNKIKSLGAHKGILLSTSNFQSGAVKYAKEHGIALIQVCDRGCEFIAHSSGEIVYDENDPFMYAERILPPYKAICYTTEAEEPKVIYPTKSMVKKVNDEMDRLIREQYGI